MISALQNRDISEFHQKAFSPLFQIMIYMPNFGIKVSDIRTDLSSFT